MKPSFRTSACIFLLAAGAQAGIVSFIPVVPGSDVVHIDNLPAQLSYDMYIKPETFGPKIDAFNVFVGSNDVAYADNDWKFAYGLGCDSPYFCIGETIFSESYRYELFLGGLTPNQDASGTLGLLIGTLTITYPPPDIQAIPGEYYFGVDPHIDGGASSIARGTTSELLFGQGVLHVIPEPATILFLAVGGGMLVFYRRYKCRSFAG
jgi:hypothetical protein